MRALEQQRTLTATADDARVVVLAPIGRDASEVCEILSYAGIACVRAATSADVVARIRDEIGAVVVTEEALGPAGARDLRSALVEQPSWSDVPILLLLAAESETPPLHIAELSLAPNVSVLQRPVAAVSLLTAVQVSLRARERQYEVRGLLAREREALRLRDEILALVSHDLRNPLNTIALTSELLLDEPGPPLVKKRLELIQRAAERMEHMINDLLDLATIEANGLTLDRKAHDAHALMMKMIEANEPMAIAKSLELGHTADLDRVSAWCDHERIEQVFANLIGNAIKYCRGGDVITVSGTASADEIKFAVADTGPGIAADEMPRLFDRYWTAKRHDAKKGTGLGLYICKGIVEAHGGKLWVESTVGLGTTFSFTIPRAATKP